MLRPQTFGALFTALALTSIAFATEAGAGKSESKVKATASATKIDADGKQTVTITLDIEKGWHLYANPVRHNNDFLNSNKTVVKVAGKVSFKVKYPEGKTKTDKDEQYDIYIGVIKITADVVREKGNTAPLEITVGVSACDDKNCLAPGSVKLMVP